MGIVLFISLHVYLMFLPLALIFCLLYSFERLNVRNKSDIQWSLFIVSPYPFLPLPCSINCLLPNIHLNVHIKEVSMQDFQLHQSQTRDPII